MGARARRTAAPIRRAGCLAHRAGRRDRARRARGDDRGRRPAFAGVAASRAAGNGRRRAAGSNGRTARWRRRFRRRTPSSLRGPQFDAAWCDELAKWRHADATFDMLQFGLRLGARPRQLITTTPRPIALIKRLLADPRTAVTRAATHANAAHLSPAFLDEVLARYAGTRLGRQEIDGEIIEDRAERCGRATSSRPARAAAPPLLRIVVGVDPPGSARPGADACGIVAAGIAEDGTIYVLEDATVQRLAPAWLGQRSGGAVSAGSRPTLVVAEVQPGRRHGARRAAAGRSRSAGHARCTRRAANGCAPSRWRCVPARQGQARRSAAARRWRTRCATSASTGCHRGLARSSRRAGMGGHRPYEARHRPADHGALAGGSIP